MCFVSCGHATERKLNFLFLLCYKGVKWSIVGILINEPPLQLVMSVVTEPSDLLSLLCDCCVCLFWWFLKYSLFLDILRTFYVILWHFIVLNYFYLFEFVQKPGRLPHPTRLCVCLCMVGVVGVEGGSDLGSKLCVGSWIIYHPKVSPAVVISYEHKAPPMNFQWAPYKG